MSEHQQVGAQIGETRQGDTFEGIQMWSEAPGGDYFKTSCVPTPVYRSLVSARNETSFTRVVTSVNSTQIVFTPLCLHILPGGSPSDVFILTENVHVVMGKEGRQTTNS
ncbi:hypothetical protein RUM43_015036 [Polyplax serrata]|uniref:Uncharacterized protein n=1 Tax=Polyplax serrata TaxID=468196 RepID=A0AAN8PFQ2_POLSC